MTRRGRPVAGVVLGEDERRALVRLTEDVSAAAETRQRARIVLACADGASDVDVAARLDVNRMTVAKWRRRFQTSGLPGLREVARPGRPRLVTSDDIALILQATLTGPPPRLRWSRRLMSLRTGMSMSTIGRIWREYGLEPHLGAEPVRGGTFAPITAVCGLYLGRGERAVALGARGGPSAGLDWPLLKGLTVRHRDEAEQRAIRHRLAQLVSVFDTRTVGTEPPEGPTLHDFVVMLERAMPTGLELRILHHGPDAVSTHPRARIMPFASPAAWKRAVGPWLVPLAEHLHDAPSGAALPPLWILPGRRAAPEVR